MTERVNTTMSRSKTIGNCFSLVCSKLHLKVYITFLKDKRDLIYDF